MVQDGLRAEGKLTGEGKQLTTLLPAHATREELRYTATYQKGQVLDVRRNAPDGLQSGRYQVQGIDSKDRVRLTDENGRKTTLDPSKIDPC